MAHTHTCTRTHGYLQSPEVNGENCEEEEELEEAITHQPHQGYDAKLLQDMVEEDDAKDGKGHKSHQVAGDSPSFSA